jgi:hypothetical protein
MSLFAFYKKVRSVYNSGTHPNRWGNSRKQHRWFMHRWFRTRFVPKVQQQHEDYLNALSELDRQLHRRHTQMPLEMQLMYFIIAMGIGLLVTLFILNT